MDCPKCKDPRAEKLFDEVDIGVGTQRHVFGVECPACGMIGLCSTCGAWDFELCRKGCPSTFSLSGTEAISTGNSELTERSLGVGPAMSRVGCGDAVPASRVTPTTPCGEVAPSPVIPWDGRLVISTSDDPGPSAVLPSLTDRALRRLRVSIVNKEPNTWVCDCGQVNTDDLGECFVCAWPKGEEDWQGEEEEQ